jgi:hypothetical protein
MLEALTALLLGALAFIVILAAIYMVVSTATAAYYDAKKKSQ